MIKAFGFGTYSFHLDAFLANAISEISLKKAIDPDCNQESKSLHYFLIVKLPSNVIKPFIDNATYIEKGMKFFSRSGIHSNPAPQRLFLQTFVSCLKCQHRWIPGCIYLWKNEENYMWFTYFELTIYDIFDNVLTYESLGRQ